MGQKKGTSWQPLGREPTHTTEEAPHGHGSLDAASKRWQRFLQRTDPRRVLERLLSDEAPFVLGAGSEIPRPQAYHTSYVGTLKDGRTKGFWVLILATPYRGRAIPCGWVTFSSEAIGQKDGSRNRVHPRAFDAWKDL